MQPISKRLILKRLASRVEIDAGELPPTTVATKEFGESPQGHGGPHWGRVGRLGGVGS